MSTSLITHLRPGVLGNNNAFPVSKYAAAWAVRSSWISDDGVVFDQRNGLGTDRAPLPRRALTLNGTNQYVTMTVDTVEAFPFTLFGFTKDPTTGVFFGLSKLSDTGINFSVLANSTSQLFIRRSVGGSSVDTVVNTSLTGWRSWVFVFNSGTSITVYKDGALVSNLTGLTDLSISSTNFLNQFNVGVRRITSPSNYGNGSRSHCGFHRGAATLENAINLHKTGELTGTEEINLPLDNNSTTVSYNIGRSASWWMNEPRRNLESYPQDLTNAVWRKSAVSPTTTKIVETATTAEHRIDNLTQFAVVAGETWSLSFSAKAAERTRIRAGFDSLGILNARGFFDLSNGTTDNTIAGSTYTITPDTEMGSGWYRCTVTSTAIGSGNVRIEINLVSGTCSLATTVNYLGDIANGAFVTNIQRERGVATTFQSVPGSGTEYPEASLADAPTSYVGRDAPISRQNTLGYTVGRNRFLRSNNASSSWTLENVTIGGTIRAQTITPTTLSGRHSFRQDRLCTGPNVISAELKANGYSIVSFGVAGGVSGQTIYFNLATGVVTGSAGSYIGSMVPLGDGWYRCSLFSTVVEAETSLNRWIIIRNAESTANYAGDGVSGVLFRIAQLEAGTVATAPQVTVTTSNLGMLIPIGLNSSLDVNGNEPDFSGPAHFDAQSEDSNCFTFDGVDDYVAMNLADLAGAELVTNASFDSGATGWTGGSNTPSGWTFSSGQLQGVSAGGGYNNLASLQSSKSYLCSVTISGYSTGSISFAVANAGTGSTYNANGTFTQVLSGVSGVVGIIRRFTNFTGNIDNVSVRELPTITHDGTSTITYRSQADGFTGTAGTAYNIRLGDVEHIPCSEGDGSVLHGTILEQAYSVVNGQASNWETLQDDYPYNMKNGFNFAGMLLYLGSPIAYDGEILTYAG